MIALFRAMHDLWAADPAFVDLVSRLRAGCAEFDTWWAAHDVGIATFRDEDPAPPGARPSALRLHDLAGER